MRNPIASSSSCKAICQNYSSITLENITLYNGVAATKLREKGFVTPDGIFAVWSGLPGYIPVAK
jgi:hypothetical protein